MRCLLTSFRKMFIIKLIVGAIVSVTTVILKTYKEVNNEKNRKMSYRALC